jgi:hypothetical protein
MATERQLNPLDEENDRLIRARRERDGDERVCRYLLDVW